MSTRRADKAVLLFNGGEVTPLLDGRSDVERMAGSCRELQNMFVDEAGAAIRRPGLEFVAEVGASTPLTHVSYEGTATLYGITELASVSDPPRKYLQLVPNYRALRRDIAAPFTRMGFSAINRTVYDLTGTRTEQVVAWGKVSSGTPYGSGAGNALLSPGDSLESMDWSTYIAPWTNTEPTWDRDRLSKWFTIDSFGTPGTSVDSHAEYGQGFGRLGGLQDTTRGVGFSVSWTGSVWRLSIHVYDDDGGAANLALYVRVAAGDQDPGTVTTSDTPVSLSSHSQFREATLDLPPDCSIRFLCLNTSGGAGDVQIPQQIDTTITNGAAGASGLTVDAYDRWYYLPASETLLPEWRFEETLCNEDTLTAAIQRSSDVVIGTDAIAATTFVSGGTAAESNDPLNWTGRVVQTSKLITGLTIGHRYSVSALVRTNTIGSTDFATTTEDGEEFVALATSTQVTYEVRAAFGKEKRVINISVADEGAEPAAPTTYDPDALLWKGKVLANGGTIADAELEIVSDFHTELKAQGLWTKLIYCLPFIGEAAGIVVPSRDRQAYGNATNTAFVDADVSLSTGLLGNGSSKRLTVPFAPSELGSSSAGGLGVWILANTSGSSPISADPNATNRFRLQLQAGSGVEIFRWGTAANNAATATEPGNHHYYGQRSSATSRALYRNGVSVATNTTSDAATDAATSDFSVFGGGSIAFCNMRLGVAYWTNGGLSGAEVTSMHTAISNFLAACGRI